MLLTPRKAGKSPQILGKIKADAMREAARRAKRLAKARKGKKKVDKTAKKTPPKPVFQSPAKTTGKKAPPKPVPRSPAKQKADDKDPFPATLKPFKRPTADKKASPALKTLQEIQYYQTYSDKPLIPKAPFCRLIEEIVQDTGRLGFTYRMELRALGLLRESAEEALVTYFSLLQHCAHHSKRVTIMRKDSDLLKALLEVLQNRTLLELGIVSRKY